MARQNRWTQFGNAFNAVYNAGTQLQSAFASGKIAMKDYEDEEGNKLTGLALDRAKMDDYAAIEQRYGDPMEALRMRTGVETLGQSKLKTDYDTATFDERVFQGGEGASNKLRADTSYTNSAAGLNSARAADLNLGTKIRKGSQNEEIAANTASFVAEQRESEAQAARKSKESYLKSLTSADMSATAFNDAQTKQYQSDAYEAMLEANNLAAAATSRTTIAEQDNALLAAQDPSALRANISDQRLRVSNNELQIDQNNLQKQVINSEEYTSAYVQAEMAKANRTANVEKINEALSQSPEFAAQMRADLEALLNNTKLEATKAAQELKLNQNPDYQNAQNRAGLSSAQKIASDAESERLIAQRRLEANTLLNEWAKTGNPKDPKSMATLVNAIKAIDPSYGNQLEQEFGEHELWGIQYGAIRLKAEAQAAMETGGAAAVRKVLDAENGERLGMRIDTNADGSMAMVEFKSVGPRGEGSEIVRTIAAGKDEKEFNQELSAALDPSSMLDYQVKKAGLLNTQADTLYKNSLSAQALRGTPPSVESVMANILLNPKSSAYDKEVAMAWMYKNSPEQAIVLKQALVAAEKIGSNLNNKLKVPGKVTDGKGQTPAEIIVEKVTANPKIEKITAEMVSALENGSIKDRNLLLTNQKTRSIIAQDPALGRKFLALEDNKTSIANKMIDEKVLTEDSFNAFIKNQSKNKGLGRTRVPTNNNNRPELNPLNTVEGQLDVLQIVIRTLQSRRPENTGGVNSQGNSDAERIDAEIQAIAALQKALMDSTQNGL